MFLGYRIELASKYTLRSFFKMAKRYDRLRELNAFFPSYLKQYAQSPESGCVNDLFDYLCFGKTVEMVGFPGEPNLTIYHWLNGVSSNDISEIRSVALENFLDMPLQLGRLKHVVFGDKMDTFDFETAYSLFEFIDGIVWELSFQGTLTACELRR